MGRAVPARVPRLQAQARPKACRVPGTARLARVVPGPWRAVPACSRAGLFSPARLASYTLCRNETFSQIIHLKKDCGLYY